MKTKDNENTLFFYSLIILLAVYKFSFAGFLYTPYLDDYVQYLYYPNFSEPFKNILFGGAGTAFTRPLAALADIYLWGKLFHFTGIVILLLSLIYAASGIFFYKTLKNLSISAGPVFLIIYTLLPSFSEGTYWISAATRIVPGLFFTSVSLMFMARGKKILFFIFSLLSHGFYEQISIISFLGAALIFLSAPKKYFKEFILAAISLILIASYYLLFGKMGDNSLRLGIDHEFYLNIGKNLSALSKLFFTKQLPLYTKGFIRGLDYIKSAGSWLWLFTLFIITYFLFSVYPKEKSYCFSKQKFIAGIILFIAPALPFFVLKDPWLNFRNVVPSALGFAIIADEIFKVFKNKVKYIAAFLCIFLCICNVSEVMDYNKTAQNDLKIIKEIQDSYSGENTIYYEITTPYYLTQNSPYHDHIMSIVGSDWGLTGSVRAYLKNRNITVNIINSKQDI